jgi:hypothetical protein
LLARKVDAFLLESMTGVVEEEDVDGELEEQRRSKRHSGQPDGVWSDKPTSNELVVDNR